MDHAARHDVVEVWRLRIVPSLVVDVAALLTDAERSHAARFVHEADRDRFVSVRGWLRRLLGGYSNQAPSELSFEIGDQGKPALRGHAGPGGVRFNVSHSGDQGVIAICRGREVGVDLEEIRDDFDVIELGSTCFSRDEHDGLRACAPDARVERFFRLWTAKEACIKALGGGLSIPLQDFSVDVQRNGERWRVTSASLAASVTEVCPLDMPRGYAGAVTAFGTDWIVRERDVDDWTS
ncbi:MAG TPA: 4'-phosphopantetheinyl transferase superfamily protein [Gemmatimonadaceae bacterium]